METKYKLVPKAIPAISKSTVYQNILDDFLKGKDKSCQVLVPKRKPSTVHQGLLKVKRANPDYSSVSVVRRGDEIYLRK